MAESSDIYRDGRVQKEAASLVSFGYDVTVLGFRSNVGAKRKFPFKLITLPVISRKWRTLRNISILLNVGLLNLRVLFTRADIYHAHNTMFLFSMFFASRIYRGKFIYDCHEVQFEAGRLQAWLEKIFIKKADVIINVSNGRADYQAKQYNVSREKIIVIRNYPDLSDLVIQNKKNQSSKIRLVFSGGFNLNDNKLDKFLEMLVGISDIKFDLIAFGYGCSDEMLKQKIKTLGLENQVQFLPLVPFNELIPTLTSYDLAVDMLTNPENSLSKRYPAINKTYEYFAAGLPIICSDMKAFKEEIEGEKAGISVNPNQIEEGRKKIVKLISDKTGLNTMKQTARTLSKEMYNWKTESNKLQTIYSKLIKS